MGDISAANGLNTLITFVFRGDFDYRKTFFGWAFFVFISGLPLAFRFGFFACHSYSCVKRLAWDCLPVETGSLYRNSYRL
jgi:hypothetical protein